MYAVDSEIMDRSKIATLDRHMHMQRRRERRSAGVSYGPTRNTQIYIVVCVCGPSMQHHCNTAPLQRLQEAFWGEDYHGRTVVRGIIPYSISLIIMIKLSTPNLRRGNGQIKIPVVIDKRVSPTKTQWGNQPPHSSFWIDLPSWDMSTINKLWSSFLVELDAALNFGGFFEHHNINSGTFVVVRLLLWLRT